MKVYGYASSLTSTLSGGGGRRVEVEWRFSPGVNGEGDSGSGVL